MIELASTTDPPVRFFVKFALNFLSPRLIVIDDETAAEYPKRIS
jgi:hypothetical protein